MPKRTQNVVRSDAYLRQAMRTYGAMVLRIALSQTGSSADAEDVYQDVFVRLACTAGELGGEHLKAWLIRATLNRCRDLGRSWWRRSHSSLDELELSPPDGARSPEELLADQADAHELWSAVHRLPSKLRAVVHLYYVEDLSVDAIADAYGISASAVRTRLSRANQKLRSMLGGTL